MQFQYSKDETVGRITMDNPPYNALTTPVFTDPTRLRDFFNDPDLKAVIVSGEGRHFCSGADPQSFAELFSKKDELEKEIDGAKELIDIIRFAPIPVAALIRGSCLGGGLEIALACHFRFAAKSAMFGFPESNHGLMPGMGGTVLFGSEIKRGKLIELILSGRMIGAEEALDLGIIDRLCKSGSIEEELKAFLEELTGQHAARLIRTVMQSIHNGKRMEEREALKEETRLFCRLAGEVQGGSR